MLERTQQLVKRAGGKLGLAPAEVDKMLATDAEHKFEIELASGKHLKAYRVQHKNKLGPYKGGVRFHPDVDLDETRALATLMSLKAAATGLPLGGGKGGVAVNPKELGKAELEELSRAYVRHLHPHIGPDRDIPAPDVNTNAQIIDWMVDEYENLTGDTSHASFTGKSLKNGGSAGREAATGRGGVIALAELLSLQGVKTPITYAVQGYGNVGAFFASVSASDHSNWHLVAASDSSATLENADGLPAQKLADFKAQGGRFTDYDGDAQKADSEAIFGQKVDVLVLAALGDAVTEANMQNIKAKYVIEMANAPVSITAHDYLTQKGVVILPDIIANAGGVVVSYLEWRQNKRGEHWTESKVNHELDRYMTTAVRDLLQAANQYQSDSLSEAAFILALERLTKN